MDNKNLVLSSENGNEIATYHLNEIHYYYKMVIPREYFNTHFYVTWENINTK